MELENMLQNYSRTCDTVEVEDMRDMVYSTIDEATQFVKTVSLMYNHIESYIPNLSGL